MILDRSLKKKQRKRRGQKLVVCAFLSLSPEPPSRRTTLVLVYLLISHSNELSRAIDSVDTPSQLSLEKLRWNRGGRPRQG